MDAVTLAVGEQGDVYPDVSGCETAFVGFCAAFYGRQDCAHIEAAGIRAVCVDRDAQKLAEMSQLYPDNWDFTPGDVYVEAERWFACGQRFDLVSLDPYTSQMQECADALELWLALASKKVVLGTGRDTWLPIDLDGWMEVETLQRSSFKGGVFWTVLERRTCFVR